jgi:exopolyphosphatase/guanosine-5'-triphosphate,3'-diphosphate pyrophosphatase
MPQPTAIIDLGTNTFQLLVATPGNISEPLQIICQLQRPVQLGLGAMETGILQNDAMDRAIMALTEFKEMAISKGCENTQIHAIGTSILRRASNTQQFLSEVERRLGIKIQVISGIEEADLIYHGIYHSLPQPWNPVSLVMDIGGGSVEFILFEGTRILFKVSLELGGLRLLSLFQQDGHFHSSQIAELQSYVLGQMKPLFIACEEHKPTVLIGAAGAFETIWDLAHADIPGSVIPPASELVITQFYQQKKLVQETDFVGRQNIKGMKAFRAGILPYANVLIATVLEELTIENMWVSSYSLKEGYWFLQNK